MKLKGPGKVFLIALGLIAAFFVVKYFQNKPKDVGQSTQAEVGSVALPDAPEASLVSTNSNTSLKLPIPSTEIAGSVDSTVKITAVEMEWQAHTAQHYANGGARTTKGSLFQKAGIDMTIIRNDDDNAFQTDFIAWTKKYHDAGSDAARKDLGGMIISDMGSQMDAYLYAIKDKVKAYGSDYSPVIFMAWGKSYGEDQVIGDIKYKQNPQNLRGAVIRGVLLGGDLDIALKFAGDNGVKINVDNKLYDPNALNFSYADNFQSAVVDYNKDLKETRKLVVNGKTGKDTSVGIDLVATWFPGDVNAMAKGKGGSTIISSRTYSAIMPCVAISCKKFLNDNRDAVVRMIAAFAQAGDQVRSFSDVKQYATKLNGQIWKDNAFTDADWLKYYNGVDNGNAHMGGSMVYNFQDMIKEFGLNNTADIYKEVYNSFSIVHNKLYPVQVPTTIPYSEAVDKSFMNEVLEKHPELLTGKPLIVTYADNITTTIAKKAVHGIVFKTNSAEILPSSLGTLNEIYSEALTSEGLKLGLDGYTDNTGNPESNITLSQARADAVKRWLIDKGVQSERLESHGHGQENPVADNSTAAGKAQNRRVEIILGN